MTMRNNDFFAADKRQQKLNEFTLPLKQLDALVNWAELAAAVNLPLKRELVHAKGGRPGYPTVVMLKILVLQQLYGNLSDEETEYALLDRLSWQQFLGLTGALNVPDARTIWHFKNRLAHTQSSSALFAAVQAQLDCAGYQAKGGQLIDATIVPSPKVQLDKAEREQLKRGEVPADWSKKKAAHKDRDAHWTIKRDQAYHGYKAHINADQKHKLVRQIEVTAANQSDISQFEALLDTSAARQEHGKTVYADKGYQSQANRQLLKQHGLRDGILRKDDRNRYDQSPIRRRNQRLSKVRARVEHIFGVWSRRGGKAVRCVGLLRATAQITVQAVAYNLRRWVSLDGGSPSFGH